MEGETSRAVVIGEWGGHYDEVKDVTWQNSLAAYLVDQCLEDTFYWVSEDHGPTTPTHHPLPAPPTPTSI